MAKITYANKVALNENPNISDINKVKDTDMNMIKNVVNNNETKVLLAVSSSAPATCDTGDIYFNTTDNLIYTATATNTWGTTGVAPTKNTIYIEFSNQTAYAYDGTTLVSVGGGSGPQVVNDYSTSQENAYSCDYLNNCETYSTTEVKTNKVYVDENDKAWPIYRVAGAKTLGAAWSTLATNVKRPTFVDIFLTVGNSNDIRPYTYIPTCELVVSGGNFWVRDTNTGSSAYGKLFYYTVEYTKITDTVQSTRSVNTYSGDIEEKKDIVIDDGGEEKPIDDGNK